MVTVVAPDGNPVKSTVPSHSLFWHTGGVPDQVAALLVHPEDALGLHSRDCTVEPSKIDIFKNQKVK